MKAFTGIVIIIACMCAQSCSVRKGCPGNGRNVGAERLLNPDKQTAKDLKKAKKFKG